MKNEKIITLSKHQKKQITITGFPAYPLQVGERAWITYSNGTFLTSNVQAILEASFDYIVFETQNTVYFLSYSSHDQKVEVISA